MFPFRRGKILFSKVPIINILLINKASYNAVKKLKTFPLLCFLSKSSTDALLQLVELNIQYMLFNERYISAYCLPWESIHSCNIMPHLYFFISVFLFSLFPS